MSALGRITHPAQINQTAEIPRIPAPLTDPPAAPRRPCAEPHTPGICTDAKAPPHEDPRWDHNKRAVHPAPPERPRRLRYRRTLASESVSTSTPVAEPCAAFRLLTPRAHKVSPLTAGEGIGPYSSTTVPRGSLASGWDQAFAVVTTQLRTRSSKVHQVANARVAQKHPLRRIPS